MMETNNTYIKNEIMASFKTELIEKSNKNKNDLSIKIFFDFDKQIIQFQKYLMTIVKKLVTEMIQFYTSRPLLLV